MLNLYRAVFQRADGSLRPMTFADSTPEAAHKTAEQWTVGDRLLTVTLDRPLQRPLLVLT
jgi:hypothetical protein